MEKRNLGRFITLLSDAVFKIKLVSQFESVKNLLHGAHVLGNKLPLMGLLLGLLLTGFVIGWGLLMTLGVFIFHHLSFSWLQGLWIMFFVNLLAVGLMALFLSRNVKKIRPKKASINQEKTHERNSRPGSVT